MTEPTPTPTSNQLSKRAPAWHVQARDLLLKNFDAVHAALLDATHRAVWLGLLLNQVKARGKADGSIPHGQFKPWVQKHLPQLSYARLAVYMYIGKKVGEKAKLELPKISKQDFCPPGELPPKVLEIIKGKGQNELFLEFKQAEIRDDAIAPKRGRRKGEGGNSAEVLAIAKLKASQADRAIREIECRKFIKWVEENVDDQRLGLISDELLERFLEACRLGAGYAGPIVAARGPARRRKAVADESDNAEASAAMGGEQ
jgi:hypothetical protein